MRSKVCILENVKVVIVAIATKMAVQIAWVDNAFRQIEMPSIEEPETKVKTTKGVSVFSNQGLYFEYEI